MRRENETGIDLQNAEEPAGRMSIDQDGRLSALQQVDDTRP